MSRKPARAKAKTPAKKKTAAKKRTVRAKTTREPKAAKVKGYSKDGLAYAKGLRD